MQKRRKKEILLLKNNEDAANETKFEKIDITGLNSELSTKKCQVNNDPNSESLLCQL